ncbi:iron-only hydrogenase system regulator [Peptococcaceae bacterium]|nr:iron-only hydrogenase system regulator [Peptococcaceae bacterium]MCL0041571.1 iron-only hydrogenase system regulator [Peptococcaceae bacterium]MCL0052651.1 iron-only hydrogenase system regulator [Peptococcaceae bacterium]MCL0063425.1 iron-only hydrogenase system regulator [Peptococcaceae bacterium]MCL0100804.1 iron-only hydrogenase system regulator [Peptococcaceae bacterium]
MEKRIGVVGIIVENRNSVPKINAILSEHADMILGRMGVPYKDKKFSVISIVIEGTTDEVGALTGKLGNVEGVIVKTALSNKTV